MPSGCSRQAFRPVLNHLAPEVDKNADHQWQCCPSILSMRKFLATSILSFCLAGALHGLSLSVGVDMASLLSLVHDTTGVGGEASLRLGDELRLSLGLGWYSTRDIADDRAFLNTALSADWYIMPDWGVYIGISLADIFFPFGLDSDGDIRFSNHLRLGFEWRLPWSSIELRLNARDLVSAGASAAYTLSEAIGQLGRFSFTFLLSFRYDWGEGGKE